MGYTKLMATLGLSALLAACVSSTDTAATTSQSNNANISKTVNTSTTDYHPFSQAQLAEIDTVRQQASIDAVRLKDLAYWTGLFEEYKQKTGIYPLQDKVKDKHILVKILSPQQRAALNLDETEAADTSGAFENKNTNELITELEAGLGRSIDKRFDPMPKPDGSPIGYFYFATLDGYLLWTPCGLCEISSISTYLMDGHTVTLNIASEGMIDKVTKAQGRDEMLNHPKYKEWLTVFEVLVGKDQ